MSEKRTFVLRDRQVLTHCLAFIGALGLLGKPWEITVKPYVRNRSRSQEKLWHAWVGILAKEKGYSAKEMKILLKAHFELFEYVTNKKTGERIPSLRSTADLDVQEYMQLITDTEILAAKEGILLPRDQDYYEALGIDKDSARNVRQEDIGHGVRASSSEHPAALRNGEM